MSLNKCYICGHPHKDKCNSFDIYTFEKGVHIIKVCHTCISRFPVDIQKRVLQINGHQDARMNVFIFEGFKNEKHLKKNYNKGYTIVVCSTPAKVENIKGQLDCFERLIYYKLRNIEIHSIYKNGKMVSPEYIENQLTTLIYQKNKENNVEDNYSLFINPNISYARTK